MPHQSQSRSSLPGDRERSSTPAGAARAGHEALRIPAGYLQRYGISPASSGSPSPSDDEAGAAPGDVSALAAQGMSGPSGAVPERARMEAAFGADFGSVRAYTGPQARAACESLGAEAYAVGDAVAFRRDDPRTTTVAHELAHVLQHRNSGGSGVVQASRVAASDHPAEREADAVAAVVAAGGQAVVREVAGDALHRNPGDEEQTEAPPTEPRPTTGPQLPPDQVAAVRDVQTALGRARAAIAEQAERMTLTQLEARQTELRALRQQIRDLPREERRQRQEELSQVEAELVQLRPRIRSSSRTIDNFEGHKVTVGGVTVNVAISGPLAAARSAVQARTGVDITGSNASALAGLNREQRPGRVYCSWHKTGRAIDFSQTIEAWVRVEEGSHFRLFLPVSDGGTGDVRGDDLTNVVQPRRAGALAGTSLVDVTAIMLNNGFTRIPENEDSSEWWHYEIVPSGMSWWQAMVEMYDEATLRAKFAEHIGTGWVTVAQLRRRGVPDSALP